MNNIKKQQFLSRLLRITELNDQLNQIDTHSKVQPAFAKKLELVKMNNFNIKLPQRNRNENIRYGSKVLVLNSNQQCHMRQYNSTKKINTNQVQKNLSTGVTVSTEAANISRKLSQTNNMVVIEKKNQFLKQQMTRDKILKYVHLINPQNKNMSESKQLPISRRNLQRKQSFRSSKIVRQPNQDLMAEIQQKLIKQTKFSQKNLSKAINADIYSDSKLDKQELAQHQKPYMNTNLMIKGTEKKQKYFKSMHHITYLSHQKNIEQQKKNKLMSIKQINKNYGRPFLPPPRITAKSYIICQIKQDQQNLKVIVSFNSKNTQQVASLTKIMTCVLIIQFCEKHSIDFDKQIVKIGKYQSSIGGTTAELKPGQMYSIIQLLHGLMLPSGNDASLALAVWCGRKLLHVDKQQKVNKDLYESLFNQNLNSNSMTCETLMERQKYSKNQCYIRFIRQMNLKAEELQLNKTHYSNCHGLINPTNRSTAYDIALLSKYAMKNKLFREIVSCKNYQTTIKYIENQQILQNAEKQYVQIDQGQNVENIANVQDINDRQLRIQMIKRPATAHNLTRPASSSVLKDKSIKFVAMQKQMTISWKNTHKLLQNKSHEYIGIKTGFTNNAGPCLSSFVKLQNRNFIIIVLGCSKMNLRFKQTQILKKWLCRQQNIGKPLKRTKQIKLKQSRKDVKSISENQNLQDDSFLQQDEKQC